MDEYKPIVSYPNMLAVDRAGQSEICRWYRFLRTPATDEQIKIMNRIVSRFKDFDGFKLENLKYNRLVERDKYFSI